jgi:hypothetical protein
MNNGLGLTRQEKNPMRVLLFKLMFAAFVFAAFAAEAAPRLDIP